ncbi:MAG: tetratricopeptide repeat protein [Candidatus Woesearchaeota archaeon]
MKGQTYNMLMWLVIGILIVAAGSWLFNKFTFGIDPQISETQEKYLDLMKEGKKLYSKAEYSEAIQIFKRMDELSGDIYHEANLYIALSYLALEKENKAEEYIKKLEDYPEITKNLEADKEDWTCCDFKDFDCIFSQHCVRPCNGPCNHHSH